MYVQPGISGRNYAQTSDIKNIRFLNQCGNYKLFKSEYIKNHYSSLLLSNENNKNYYKNLISVLSNKNNVNIKLNASKLMIQYSELIKKFIDELESTKSNICDKKSKNFKHFKHDIMVLHWLEYSNYKNALNLLSECKNYSNKITKYDIEDKIDEINYKTNLSAIQFVYSKIDYFSNDSSKEFDLYNIENIIKKYEIDHDDNILNKIKEIENKYKIVEGFGNKKNNNIIIIFVIIIFIIVINL